MKRKWNVLGSFALTAGCLSPSWAEEQHPKPNILFFAVDDLRPLLGCYGNDLMQTPNIDRLAGRGVVFERAYCQFAACGPSRASVLTGMYPEKAGVYDQVANFRETSPDAVSLPEWLKNNGYFTVGMGKVFHHGHQDNQTPHSWSRWVQSLGPGYLDPSNIADLKRRREKLEARKKAGETFTPHQEYILTVGPATEAADVPDARYPDGILADAAIKELHALSREAEPFFLAVGFRKPHLPLVVPKKYWDVYDPEEIGHPSNPLFPAGAPSFHTHDSYELRHYADIPRTGGIPEEIRRRVAHGYYAACSFIDAQAGRVLDELERLGLADNTVVVLWGDHGFHLGENGIITKDTNYEVALHAPLIISGPARLGIAQGEKSPALVEFVDIFPTLCELVGIPIPGQVQGDSLLPLLEDPGTEIKEAVFSVNRRSWQHNYTGYAMRTERYRYIRWKDEKGRLEAEELYDYDREPDEPRNLVVDPEYREVLNSLREKYLAHRPARKEDPLSRRDAR